ncbi:ABC transporter ATP-binding protein [Nocardioides dongxiaopingii]|uniref:ABC transporter ATP-binding protein n=1 Tax=Nocardioides sp. S-1144 TaxID=2582905 RepID=UPI00110DC9B4|nr:ABC transporter ATP-binding protein [Nocardioides sp. S-1144]QCW50713.1 ABC transporter ATP-binding protein [Nocardioides sp. S-1144]
MPTKPESPDLSRDGGPDVPPGPVIETDGLEVHYRLQGGALARVLGLRTRTVKALDGVTVQLQRGEVLGVVGESGSGKTTLGRALLGLAPSTQGSITYRGRDGERLVSHMKGAELRRLRTDVQMVFQDPSAALNPSMTIEQAVGHPLVVHKIARGAELRRRVHEALERVGLAPVERFASKYPSDLSGGQKQRAVIARAIILDPEVLVADEPISMLDMSVRAKILQLMLDLKRDLGLSYVYITHDLASAKYFCDRIAIMYLGRVVEIGPTEEIFANPRHPYTKALLKAIPDPDPDRMLPRDLPRGEIPDAAEPPLGCSFHPRCPEAVATCGWESRDLRVVLDQHWTERGTDFDTERRLVGDLEHLDTPSKTATLGKGDPAAVLRLMEGVRAENPDEPLWNGVRSMESDGSKVVVEFEEGVDPPLRRAGGVDVACVLYPEGSSPDAPAPG